ncbi:hypothetical protein CRUP_000898 [Coryphaenoides rupestris]|nr:hypothetical protein CRUP_000898 [Coryphaenoides rupestris]
MRAPEPPVAEHIGAYKGPLPCLSAPQASCCCPPLLVGGAAPWSPTAAHHGQTPSSTQVLRDNPLVCSCEFHWLQQWERSGRGDPDNQPMTCFSFGQEMPLNVVSMDNCTLPEVTILPSVTKVQEGGTLMFECHVSGTPTPEARWRTDMLYSRHEVEVRMHNTLQLAVCYPTSQ